MTMADRFVAISVVPETPVVLVILAMLVVVV